MPKGKGYKHAKFNPMSTGGLSPTKKSGKGAQGSKGVKSDVSGHAPPGGTPSGGEGGVSPTAASAADQAAGGNNRRTTNVPGRHNP